MTVNTTSPEGLAAFIDQWRVDGLRTRDAFVRLSDQLLHNEHSRLSFHPRPGITCSLRASIAAGHGGEELLYAMVDVIDDDPEQRWLSVCFYGERISDPEQRGDLVPGGLLGRDAVCFDYDAQDADLLEYISCRCVESYDASRRAAGI